MKREELYSLCKAFCLLVFLISIFFFLHFSGLHEKYLTPEHFRNYIAMAGIWAPLLFISLYALPIFSDSVFAMLGGILFGPLFGTVYSVIGALFSTSLAFFISRYLGRDFVARRLSGGWKLFDEDMERFGFRVILFLRLVPIFPYEGINYGAGLTKIKYYDYLIATLLGIIPAAFAYNFFGDFLVKIVDPFYILPIYVILFVIIGPLIIRHYRKRARAKL
jgi:uncharacterized membrane protein YdjX (TVP38/TMEM64 family)